MTTSIMDLFYALHEELQIPHSASNAHWSFCSLVVHVLDLPYPRPRLNLHVTDRRGCVIDKEDVLNSGHNLHLCSLPGFGFRKPRTKMSTFRAIAQKAKFEM